MKVDLRYKIKKEKMMRELPVNHREIFKKRLEEEMHENSKSRFQFLKIAASIVIIMSLGIIAYQFDYSGNSQEITQTEGEPEKKINSMADISPDLKKVEDYYLTHINYQIAKLKITDENREFLEAYFVELGKLQTAYNRSIAELNSDEISEETINSLIDNLQMRLKLVYQLKSQLKKINNLNKQENENSKV